MIIQEKERTAMPLELSRVRALCFDMDGTLSDTDDQWVERLTQAFSRLPFLFPRRQPRPFARWLTMRLETPANAAYHLLDRLHLDDEALRLLAALQRWRESRPKAAFWLIAGVGEMLKRLHGRLPMAIVSARDEDGVLAFLRQHKLQPFFAAVASAQTCAYTKPFPDPVRWAAQQMGVPPEACLMIGDTVVDIRAGRAAGAQTVGVLCGFGSEAELRRAGADLILASTAQLADYLTG